MSEHTIGPFTYRQESDGSATLLACATQEQYLRVPDTLEGCPVKAIGPNAFRNAPRLREVDLPQGLERLSREAFARADNLRRLHIPRSVTVLGPGGCQGCHSLEEVILPPGITAIPEQFFDCCRSLTTVEIPQGVTSIGDSAFFLCDSLTQLDLPQSLTAIAENAFRSCSALTRVTLPDTLEYIGPGAFDSCPLVALLCSPDTAGHAYALEHNIPTFLFTQGDYSYCLEVDGTAGIVRWHGDAPQVTVPAELDGIPVTVIRSNAFSHCRDLRQVILPQGIRSLGDHVFLHCVSLERADLPASLETTGTAPFLNCRSLRELNVHPDNPHFWAMNGALYTTGGTLVNYPSAWGAVQIREGVVAIAPEAFSLCSGITGITFPYSLRSIGYYAFNWCECLEQIRFREGLETIGNFAFHQCSGLTRVTLPVSLRRIAETAFFGCDSLRLAVDPTSPSFIYVQENGIPWEKRERVRISLRVREKAAGPQSVDIRQYKRIRRKSL